MFLCDSFLPSFASRGVPSRASGNQNGTGWPGVAAAAAAAQPGHAVQNAPFQCLLHFAHLSEVFGRPALRLLPAAGADLSSSSPVSATLSPASASGPILFVHTQRMERACVRNFPGPVGSTAPSGKDAAVAPAGGSEGAPCVSMPGWENSVSGLGLPLGCAQTR